MRQYIHLLPLSLIALVLATMAVRPTIQTPSVYAQSAGRNLFIEPGVTSVRIPDGTGFVQGKVVMDLDTGDLWGFPTNSSAPYPVDLSNTKPPVSKPIYLGKFDLAELRKR